MTKRVLITGQAGFIGFHVAKSLKAQGHQVEGFDQFNDYYDPDLKKARAHLLESLGIETHCISLNQPDLIRKLIESFQPTHILHLAAQAGVRYSLENPMAYIESNVEGFVHLLEVLKSFPKIPLVYASSSSIYGDTAKVPFHEEDTKAMPINLYGVTKKSNELTAFSYHQLFNLKVCGLRFFTVYGPWGRPDMAYYLFAKKMLHDEPLTVYEGQNIMRDFTYIDDIVDGIESALDYPFECEVFNLGNHKPVSLNHFIETLEEAMGKKAIRHYQPKALGDMEKTYADIDKAQKLLGFTPKTELSVGLKRFAQWFQSHHLDSAVQKS